MMSKAAPVSAQLSGPVDLPGDDFAQQVLQLTSGEHEDVYDAKIMSKAKEYGVSLPTVVAAKSAPFAPAAVQNRRSISTDSQESGLSNLTFDLSKPAETPRADKASVLWSNRRGSTTSSSLKDHDSVLDRVRSNARRSLNLSPPSTPPRTSSSFFSETHTEPSPRRNLMRGFSRLRLRRTESANSLPTQCPHCPNDGSRQRRSIHRLPCGHTYCTMALRKIIKNALAHEGNPIAECCKQPIPAGLVELVMSQEEQDTLIRKMLVWDDSASSASSVSALVERPLSYPQARPAAPNKRHRTLSEESSVLAMQEAHMNLEKALEVPDFQTLRKAQYRQRTRFVEWDKRHRRYAQTFLEKQKREIEADFAAQKENLVHQHEITIADVEDKHVAAEASLREKHNTAKRNTAIALRHMEAYCRGESANGQLHNRLVNDQDRRELERTRNARDQMDSRQESAINVLRGEQNRRMKLRLQRQDSELEQLQNRQDKAVAAAQTDYDDQMTEWEDEVSAKRGQLEGWWILETETWRRKLERDTGVLFDGDLPRIPWLEDVRGPGQKTEGEEEQVLGGANEFFLLEREACISTTFALKGSVAR